MLRTDGLICILGPSCRCTDPEEAWVCRNSHVQGQREPRVVDSDYKGWVARLPCVACFVLFGLAKLGVHVAHVSMADAAAGWRGAGGAEKAHDFRTVPLCPGHHQNFPNAQHKIGEPRFWALCRINPTELCAALVAAYMGGRDGAIIIAQFAGRARNQEVASC